MLASLQGYADAVRGKFRSQKEVLQKSFTENSLWGNKNSNSRNFTTAAPSYPITAECFVGPRGKVCGGGEEQADTCVGKVTFVQPSEDICNIAWDLTGCGKEGEHGFHIHEKADFSNGCDSAGPHYNPFGNTRRNIQC